MGCTEVLDCKESRELDALTTFAVTSLGPRCDSTHKDRCVEADLARLEELEALGPDGIAALIRTQHEALMAQLSEWQDDYEALAALREVSDSAAFRELGWLNRVSFAEPSEPAVPVEPANECKTTDTCQGEECRKPT